VIRLKQETPYLPVEKYGPPPKRLKAYLAEAYDPQTERYRSWAPFRGSILHDLQYNTHVTGKSSAEIVERIKQADANADDWFADFAEKYDIESITKAVLNDQAALDELTKTFDAHPVTGEKLTKGRYSAIHLELEDWQRTVKNPIARDYIERLHSALREIFEQAGDQEIGRAHV